MAKFSLNPELNVSKVSEQYSGFMTALFVAVAVILLVIFLIKPKVGEIMAGREELEKGQQKLEQLNKKTADLQNLSEPELRSQVVKVLAALPSEKDVPGFMATLERLLGESGLQLETVQLTPGLLATDSAKLQTTADKLDFQLSAKGSFEQIRTFLERLPKTSRIMSVRQAAISAREAGTDQELKANLQMTFYWQPLPETLGNIADPLPVLTANEEKLYEDVSRFSVLGATAAAQPAGKTDPFATF